MSKAQFSVSQMKRSPTCKTFGQSQMIPDVSQGRTKSLIHVLSLS